VKRAAAVELLAHEDEALLVRRDALLVLDLLLHVLDSVRRLHVQRDGLAHQRLDEDLPAAAKVGHEVERRLLLGVGTMVQSAAEVRSTLFTCPRPRVNEITRGLGTADHDAPWPSRALALGRPTGTRPADIHILAPAP
jgi:hypothetical protein